VADLDKLCGYGRWKPRPATVTNFDVEKADLVYMKIHEKIDMRLETWDLRHQTWNARHDSSLASHVPFVFGQDIVSSNSCLLTSLYI
jgi:hypothetical protein